MLSRQDWKKIVQQTEQKDVALYIKAIAPSINESELLLLQQKAQKPGSIPGIGLGLGKAGLLAHVVTHMKEQDFVREGIRRDVAKEIYHNLRVNTPAKAILIDRKSYPGVPFVNNE